MFKKIIPTYRGHVMLMVQAGYYYDPYKTMFDALRLNYTSLEGDDNKY